MILDDSRIARRLVFACALLTASACTSNATSNAKTPTDQFGEAATTTEVAVDVATSVAPTPTPTTAQCRIVTDPPPPNIKRGDCGTMVSNIQSRLLELGFTPPFDSFFGPETEQAVKSYQASVGLEADGLVGPLTYGALFGDTGD